MDFNESATLNGHSQGIERNLGGTGLRRFLAVLTGGAGCCSLALAVAPGHALAQELAAAPHQQPSRAQAVATVPRVAHPYDPIPVDVAAFARVPTGPTDPYRRPYDQYLGGWTQPPPQLYPSQGQPAAQPAAAPLPPLGPLPQVEVSPPRVPPREPQLARLPPPRPAEKTGPRYGEGSVLGVSELRFGALAHNRVPLSDEVEHGMQANIEARFRSPEILRAAGAPRPTLGLSVNTAGDTSFLYGGLTWGGFVWNRLFLEAFLGAAAHDGEVDSDDPGPHDRTQFGSRVLFRGAVEVGYRFLDNHSISIMLDHYSNLGLASPNQGSEDVGLRYGYKF